HDISGAVESLPNLTPKQSTPEREALAGTGTDPLARHRQELTAQGQREEDVPGRDLSDSDAIAGSLVPMAMTAEPLENRESDVSCRVLSNTGGGNRTHTGVPPQRILSPQRLPFRHAGKAGSVKAPTPCDNIRAILDSKTRRLLARVVMDSARVEQP